MDLTALGSKWKQEIETADKHFADWAKRARKIVKRYRDDRDTAARGQSRYNILWSNVQIMLPAVYAKRPKPEVSRRYDDHDPVGRVASMILERSLSYELEHYPDYHSAMRNSVLDRLLPGRGVAWVRYDPHVETVPTVENAQDIAEGEAPDDPAAQTNAQITDDAPPGLERIAYECAPTDYVAWEDFLHEPANTWEEVEWVARRVYMAKEKVEARFGAEIAKAIPYAHRPEAYKNEKQMPMGLDHLARAEIWEIWHKPTSTVVWIAKGYDVALDAKPDPLRLDGFFPCPKPVYATLTTDSLIPVPDFAQYQDQAAELDDVTQRIKLLVKACKVAGVYDASAKGLQNVLSEASENKLFPVDSWAMFAERGGVKGAIQFLPLAEIVAALQQLYTARESIKQVIYEVTGIADIVRGASDAGETATAQQIKSRFASLRIQELQNDVARYGTDLLRLKAQIMCRFYRPETLVEMSGIMQTPEAQQNPAIVAQAVALLKADTLRAFRIEVATDSMVDIDVEQEKQRRVEFLAASSQFIERALPIAQAQPDMIPLLGEMLRFGVQGFRVARPLEASFDATLAKLQEAKPMPPEIAQAQQAIAAKEQELSQAAQSVQDERQRVAQDKLAVDYAKKEFDLMQRAAADRERLKGDVAKWQASQSEQVEAFKAKGLQDVAGAVDGHMNLLRDFAKQVADALQQMGQAIAESRQESAAAIAQVAEGVTQTQALLLQYAKAKRTPVRGPDGRVAGVQIEGFTETMQ